MVSENTAATIADMTTVEIIVIRSSKTKVNPEKPLGTTTSLVNSKVMKYDAKGKIAIIIKAKTYG